MFIIVFERSTVIDHDILNCKSRFGPIDENFLQPYVCVSFFLTLSSPVMPHGINVLERVK
jgi:hypothetical protein